MGSEVKASACNAGDLGSIPAQSRTRLTRLSSSSYLLGVRLIFVMINPLNIGSQNMLPRSATSASPGT